VKVDERHETVVEGAKEFDPKVQKSQFTAALQTDFEIPHYKTTLYGPA